MELDKEIDKYLSEKEEKVRERSYFYVSEIGKSKKEIYNNFKNPKAFSKEARVKRILENGDYMHARYFKYFAEMGILIAAEVTAVENELIHGRADAIISDKKKLYLVDLKSCSQWTFNTLKEAPHDAKLQLLCYMYYLNIPNGILLYENKDNQAIKIFNIELDETNKKLIERVLDELRKLREMINKNIEPLDEPLTLETLEYSK